MLVQVFDWGGLKVVCASALFGENQLRLVPRYPHLPKIFRRQDFWPWQINVLRLEHGDSLGQD